MEEAAASDRCSCGSGWGGHADGRSGGCTPRAADGEGGDGREDDEEVDMEERAEEEVAEPMLPPPLLMASAATQPQGRLLSCHSAHRSSDASAGQRSAGADRERRAGCGLQKVTWKAWDSGADRAAAAIAPRRFSPA